MFFDRINGVIKDIQESPEPWQQLFHLGRDINSWAGGHSQRTESCHVYNKIKTHGRSYVLRTRWGEWLSDLYPEEGSACTTRMQNIYCGGGASKLNIGPRANMKMNDPNSYHSGRTSLIGDADRHVLDIPGIDIGGIWVNSGHREIRLVGEEISRTCKWVCKILRYDWLH